MHYGGGGEFVGFWATDSASDVFGPHADLHVELEAVLFTNLTRPIRNLLLFYLVTKFETSFLICCRYKALGA